MMEQDLFTKQIITVGEGSVLLAGNDPDETSEEKLTTDQVIFASWDKVEPAQIETKSFSDRLLDQISIDKNQLEEMLLIRAKNILVANEFQPYPLDEGQTLEDYVAEVIIKELETQRENSESAYQQIKYTALPHALSNDVASGFHDYVKKDEAHLRVRAEAHRFMVGYINGLNQNVELETGEIQTPGQFLAPKYIVAALPYATREIQSIYDDRERDTKTKLKLAEAKLEAAAEHSTSQEALIESLASQISELEADRSRVIADNNELYAQNAKLAEGITERDIQLWEHEVGVSDVLEERQAA